MFRRDFLKLSLLSVMNPIIDTAPDDKEIEKNITKLFDRVEENFSKYNCTLKKDNIAIRKFLKGNDNLKHIYVDNSSTITGKNVFKIDMTKHFEKHRLKYEEYNSKRQLRYPELDTYPKMILGITKNNTVICNSI